MTSARIEHINLNVSDPGRAAAMAIALFGWAERWRGAAADERGADPLPGPTLEVSPCRAASRKTDAGWVA